MAAVWRTIQIWVCILVFLPAAWAARFAVLADLHVSPGNDNETQLEKAVDEINAGKFDFVVVPGDLTNQGSEAELDAVKRCLDRLTAPTFAIPGNHETNWSPTAGQGWIRRWGGERVDGTVGSTRIIGFSTGPYLKMGDGFVRSDDLTWLAQTLGAGSKDQTVVLLAHYPLTDGVGNWREVQNILKANPVAVVIGGHWHRIRLFNYDGTPGILSRSLVMDKNFGYGIVEITPDEIVYAEKVLGQPAQERMRLKRGNPAGWQNAAPLPEAAALPPPSDGVELVWRDPATIYTGAAVAGDRCYFGTSDGSVKAVNWKTKQLLWNAATGGPVYSTPVCADGVVAAGAVDNRILGLDAATGKTRWEVRTSAPVSGDGAAADGAFYIGDSAGVFYKIELQTGKVLFRKKIADARFQARPLIRDGVIYAPAWDNHLYALRAADGEVLWRWTHGKSNLLYSPANSAPVWAANRVFVATPDRYLNAIDAATGATVFRSKECLYRESIGLSADGKMIYAKTMKGDLAAIPADSPDGKAAWIVPLGWSDEHNPCPELEVGGLIYAGSRQGEIAAVAAASPHAVETVRCGRSEVNRFTALPDGSVLATLIEGTIFRLRHDASQRR